MEFLTGNGNDGGSLSSDDGGGPLSTPLPASPVTPGVSAATDDGLLSARDDGDGPLSTPFPASPITSGVSAATDDGLLSARDDGEGPLSTPFPASPITSGVSAATDDGLLSARDDEDGPLSTPLPASPVEAGVLLAGVERRDHVSATPKEPKDAECQPRPRPPPPPPPPPRHRSLPPFRGGSLLEDETRRRALAPSVLPNSAFEEEGPVVCPSDEYGEYGMLKVICARSAKLLGMHADKNKAIVIGRKTVIDKDVVIRGDLESVQIGHYCYVGERSVLRPPWMIAFADDAPDGSGGGSGGAGEGDPTRGEPSKCCVWSRLTLGNHVVCGRDVVCEALAVGSCVQIGDGAVLGKHCVVKDCVLILPGAVLPPFMVVPPFAIVEGAPARIVGELPESAAEEYKLQAERTCRRRMFVKVSGS